MEISKKIVAYLVLILNTVAFYLMPIPFLWQIMNLTTPDWVVSLLAIPAINTIMYFVAFPPLNGFLGFLIIFFFLSNLNMGRRFRIVAKYITLGNLILFPLILTTLGIAVLFLPVITLLATAYFIYIIFIWKEKQIN